METVAPTRQMKVDNPLEVMQPGEQVICVIRRHPIGMIGIYVATGLVLAAVLSAAILAPYYLTMLTGDQKVGIWFAAGLLILLTLLFTYISVYVYQSNRWIVTSDSITQVTQTSLFDRHANQLSLEKLEDVSAEQHNLIQEFLGYGDVTLETAGAEPGKFVFQYCPNPNDYARKIIAAQEAFMARRTAEPVYASAAAPAMYAQTAPVDPNNLPPAGSQPPVVPSVQ